MSTNAVATATGSQRTSIKIITWNAHHNGTSAIDPGQRTTLLKAFLRKAGESGVDFVCLQEVRPTRLKAAIKDTRFRIAERNGQTSVLYDSANWTAAEFDLDDEEIEWAEGVGSRIALAQLTHSNKTCCIVGSLHGRWGRLFRDWRMRHSALGYLLHGLTHQNVIIGGDVNVEIQGQGDEGCEGELNGTGFKLIDYTVSERRLRKIDFVITNMEMEGTGRSLNVLPVQDGKSEWLGKVDGMISAEVESRLKETDPRQMTIFDHDPIYCQLSGRK